jgi:hypothetical protein
MIRAETTQEVDNVNGSQSMLSEEEHSVLSLFRKYLMSPGKMLCLSGKDLEANTEPLDQLTSKGLLVNERFPGGYSLTEAGYAAMKDGD